MDINNNFINIVILRNNEIAVNCRNINEMEKFISIIKDYIDNYITKENKIIQFDKKLFFKHKENTCVDIFNEHCELKFSSISFYQKLNFSIIDFDVFINLKNIIDFCEKNNIKFNIEDIKDIKNIFSNYNKKLSSKNFIDFGLSI